jgi:hypothetical protein
MSDIGEIVGSRVNSGFQVLEISFAEKVAKEMRAELNRQVVHTVPTSRFISRTKFSSSKKR